MRKRVVLFIAGSLAITHVPSFSAETITYVYDAKGRLIEARRTGTVNNNVKSNYYYDRAHNRSRILVTGSPNLPPP